LLLNYSLSHNNLFTADAADRAFGATEERMTAANSIEASEGSDLVAIVRRTVAVHCGVFLVGKFDVRHSINMPAPPSGGAINR
jgi:hypothetical protein